MSAEEKKDDKKDAHGGGKTPPSPMLIAGLGLAIMLVLFFVGAGLADFGRNVANFSIGFRIGKADFIQFLLYLLGAAGIAMWLFGPKKH